MPRTKARKKASTMKLSDAYADRVKNMKINVENKYKSFEDKLDRCLNEILLRYKIHCKEQMLAIPLPVKRKTVSEAKNCSSSNWLSNYTNASNILSSTLQNSNNNNSKKGLKRSMSFVDDEGYLTAESSSGTSGGRQSRRTSKRAAATSRVSRSLSRSQMQKTKVNAHKTPLNRQPPPASYATVTPKLKPNTPQVLLRRPKQGEVALSLQGSPLFTGSVVSETIANVNIPLNDGRLLSIQPQRGLRMSQIPDLDPDVKRQLETLRDNLNKVCALNTRR